MATPSNYGYGAGLNLLPNLRRQTVFGGGPPPTNNPFQPNPFEPVDVEEPVFDYSNPFPDAPSYSEVSRQPPSVSAPPIQKGGTSTAELTSLERLKQIGDQFYTPEYVDRDRLRDLLRQAPVRENPGLFRTIAASISGLGAGDKGIEVGDKIMNAPYARDLAEWTAKVDPYYKAAELENRGNINERQMAGQMSTGLFNFETAERRAAETERKNKANEDLTRRKLTIQQEKNNGAKFKVDGEYVIGMRPDGSTWNTGTRTTDWDPFDLENLQHDNKMQEIAYDIMGRAYVKGVTPGYNPAARTPPSAAQMEGQRNEELLRIGKNPSTDERHVFVESIDGGQTFTLIPPFKAGDKKSGFLGFGNTYWTQREEDAYNALAQKLYPGAIGGGTSVTPTASGVTFNPGQNTGQGQTQQAPGAAPNATGEVNFTPIPNPKQRPFPEILGRDQPNPPPPSGAGNIPTTSSGRGIGPNPLSITGIMGRVGQMQPPPIETPAVTSFVKPKTLDEAQQGVISGKYYEIRNIKTGEQGWIPTNDNAAMQEAIKHGWKVITGGR